MKTDLHPAPEGYPIKLVRDGTPAVINHSGESGELFYAAMPPNLDRAEWLCRKLGEEVVEYLIGRTASELCDVLAVIEALLETHGENLHSALQSLKTHPRGGFRHATMMYGRHEEFDGRSEHETPQSSPLPDYGVQRAPGDFAPHLHIAGNVDNH